MRNTPTQTPPPPVQQQGQLKPQSSQSQKDRKGEATASLILGIISIFAWFIPAYGFFIQIVAVVLGIFFGIIGFKSSKRGQAIAGIILSIISLILLLILYLAPYRVD